MDAPARVQSVEVDVGGAAAGAAGADDEALLVCDVWAEAAAPLRAVEGGAPAHRSLHRVIAQWPDSSPHACLHCCEPIAGRPLPAVRHWDLGRGRYTVFGAFCRPGCALGHLQEAGGADAPNCMAHTRVLLRKAFGLRAGGPCPPRYTLRKFGGPLTLPQFYGEPVEGGGCAANATPAHPPRVLGPSVITHAVVLGVQRGRAGGGGSSSSSSSSACGRTDPAEGDEGDAYESADRSRVRGVRRPTRRTTPWVEGHPTGLEPLLLRAVAELGGAPRDDGSDDERSVDDEVAVGAAHGGSSAGDAGARGADVITDADVAGLARRQLPRKRKASPPPHPNHKQPPKAAAKSAKTHAVHAKPSDAKRVKFVAHAGPATPISWLQQRAPRPPPPPPLLPPVPAPPTPLAAAPQAAATKTFMPHLPTFDGPAALQPHTPEPPQPKGGSSSGTSTVWSLERDLEGLAPRAPPPPAAGAPTAAPPKPLGVRAFLRRRA